MKSWAYVVVLFLVLLARPAFAELLLTPYAGIVFGGAPNTIDLDKFRNVSEKRFSLGGSLAGIGSGVWGWEVDLNYTPDFYQRSGARGNLALIPALDSRLTTLMANAVIGTPGKASTSGIRPYAAVGIGILSANIVESSSFTTNHLAFNAGGGFYAFFTKHASLRADLRYFRNFDARVFSASISVYLISTIGAAHSVSPFGSAGRPRARRCQMMTTTLGRGRLGD